MDIVVFDQIEELFGPKLINIDFGQENFAQEVLQLLSSVRDHKVTEASALAHYWRVLFKRLRKQDNSVPETELRLFTSLVFDYSFVVLSCSRDASYNFEMAECLLEADETNNEEGLEARVEALYAMSLPYESEMTQWIENFIEESELADCLTENEPLENKEGIEFVNNQNNQSDMQKIEQAEEKMNELIIEARDKNKSSKEILRPYVAAIRARIIINSMSHKEFNDKYGTDVPQSSFSEYCPKGDKIGKFTEKETEPIEIKLRQIAGIS